MKIIYFETAAEFRHWLAQHHESATEQWLGYYKKSSGRASISWPESVAEALCYGWIDGIRKRVDEQSYTIRFTPRMPQSVWSAVNIRTAQELIAANRMRPAGLRAFQQRQENRSGIYSYEQRSEDLPEPYQQSLKQHKVAWQFFQSQSASYRKAACWWVISAKREETRLKRLHQLIQNSAAGRTIPQFTRQRQ